MMDRLARAPVPLLARRPGRPPGRRGDRLRLTDAGARVLAGEADHVTLNGIDRWIGGVHLHGRRALALGRRHRGPRTGAGGGSLSPPVSAGARRGSLPRAEEVSARRLPGGRMPEGGRSGGEVFSSPIRRTSSGPLGR